MYLLPIIGNFVLKSFDMGKNTKEAEEQKYLALRNAIKEGVDIGIATDFDHVKHLLLLKGNRLKNG